MLVRLRALVDDPRVPVVLMVMAVLLSGTGVGAVGMVGDDAPRSSGGATDDVAGPPGSGNDPLPRHSASGATSSTAAPTTTTPPEDGPATTAMTAAETEVGPPDPVLTVTTPGRYRERFTSTSDGRQETQELTLVVEDLGGSGDDQRRRLRRESDGNDAGTALELAWRPGGVFLLVTTMGAGGFEIRCEHDPPLLQSPRQLELGASWEGEDSCEFDSAGGGTIEFAFAASVRDTAVTSVAETAVATWVIDTVTDVTVTTNAFGRFEQHSEGSSWVDPSRGLTVRSEDDRTFSQDGPGGNGTQKSHVVRELLTLEPR